MKRGGTVHSSRSPVTLVLKVCKFVPKKRKKNQNLCCLDLQPRELNLISDFVNKLLCQISEVTYIKLFINDSPNFLSNHLENIGFVFQRSWIITSLIKPMGKTQRKCFKYTKVFEKSIFCGMFESWSCSYFGAHLVLMQMEIIFLHYLMGILITNLLHIYGKHFCNMWLPRKVRWKPGSIF